MAGAIHGKRTGEHKKRASKSGENRRRKCVRKMTMSGSEWCLTWRKKERKGPSEGSEEEGGAHGKRGKKEEEKERGAPERKNNSRGVREDERMKREEKLREERQR